MRKEWIIRLLKTLTEQEYKQVMRKAKSSGFTVDGFKDVTKAPRSTLYAMLGSNSNNMQKHLKNLVCMTNAIISQCEEAVEHEQANEIVELRDKIARSALHNGMEDDKSIDKMLEELEDRIAKTEDKEDRQEKQEVQTNVLEENSRKPRYLEPSDDSKKEVEELKRHVARLTEEIDNVRAKCKRQEEKVRLLNMEKESLEKTNKRLEKDLNHAKACEESQEALSKLKEAYANLEKERDSLMEKVKDMDKELTKANEQLEEYQEENRRKVLMFSKKELPFDHFEGYRIQIATSFGIDYRIPWNDFDEVWVISRDFDYAAIREIERASEKEVYTFYSHKVITTA